MSVLFLHGDYRTPFECRKLYPITIRGRCWVAVLRVGPWSLVLTRPA